MVVQNHNTALVWLALIVLCMAVGFGMILTGVQFGPSQDVKDEKARVDIRATEGALSAIQTPQAVFAGQTAIAGELTALPPIQTATAIEIERNLVAIQQAATQTRTAEDSYLDGLAVGATATTIAQKSSSRTEINNTSLSLAIMGVITFCIWVVGHTVVTMLRAHAQHKASQAGLLNEQRQLAEFRAAHQKGQSHISQPSIPTSLMKHRGNGHERSKAG